MAGCILLGKRKNRQVNSMKEMNMSGWYKAKFINQSEEQIDMEFHVTEDRIYFITLTLKELKIRMKCGYISRLIEGFGENFAWIPKYMLRPNKIGKEIFDTNPQFILKLWSLVADKEKLKSLKNVNKPLVVTVEF